MCFACMNWLFIAVSCSFFCGENVPKRFFYIICSRPAPLEDFCTIMIWFCTTCEALYTMVHMTQAAGFCRSWGIDLFLAPKCELLQSNSYLLGCKKVMETRAKFHFSWIYTFFAMLSSLRNWANHDRYWLRPSTPTQLCWSSSRLQSLQKI